MVSSSVVELLSLCRQNICSLKSFLHSCSPTQSSVFPSCMKHLICVQAFFVVLFLICITMRSTGIFSSIPFLLHFKLFPHILTYYTICCYWIECMHEMPVSDKSVSDARKISSSFSDKPPLSQSCPSRWRSDTVGSKTGNAGFGFWVVVLCSGVPQNAFRCLFLVI